MRRIVIALLLLLVSDAATAVAQPAKQNPSAQAPQKGHCNIGVVSHLGEKFRVEKRSFVEWKVSEVPVESWHLDDLVIDRIRGALGEQRAAVRRIPYRKEALAVFEMPKPFRFLYWGAAIRTLAPGTRCARYILATDDIFDDGNSQELAGLGIVKYALGDLEIHAVITVWVFDGETFKLLKKKMAYPPYQSLNTIVRKVDESFWPDSPESAAQNAKLRDATRELVTQELDAMLQKLPLTP